MRLTLEPAPNNVRPEEFTYALLDPSGAIVALVMSQISAQMLCDQWLLRGEKLTKHRILSVDLRDTDF